MSILRGKRFVNLIFIHSQIFTALKSFTCDFCQDNGGGRNLPWTSGARTNHADIGTWINSSSCRSVVTFTPGPGRRSRRWDHPFSYCVPRRGYGLSLNIQGVQGEWNFPGDFWSAFCSHKKRGVDHRRTCRIDAGSFAWSVSPLWMRCSNTPAHRLLLQEVSDGQLTYDPIVEKNSDWKIAAGRIKYRFGRKFC